MSLHFETGIENPFDVFGAYIGVNYSIGLDKSNTAAFTFPLLFAMGMMDDPESSTDTKTSYGIGSCPELTFRLSEKFYFKIGCLLSYNFNNKKDNEIVATALIGLGIEF